MKKTMMAGAVCVLAFGMAAKCRWAAAQGAAPAALSLLKGEWPRPRRGLEARLFSDRPTRSLSKAEVLAERSRCATSPW